MYLPRSTEQLYTFFFANPINKLRRALHLLTLRAYLAFIFYHLFHLVVLYSCMMELFN